MENATVKGPIFIGARKWILENMKSGWDNILAAMPEADQPFWKTFNILPISQVPAVHYSNMYNAFLKLWDEETFQTCAGAVALDDLGTFMRFFMRIGSPGMTFSHFPKAYRQYFNIGEFKILSQDAEAGEAELAGADVYGQGGCSGTLGWTRRALEYSGAKQLKVWHPECRFKGQNRCLLKFTWA